MLDLIVLILHLLTTVARLAGPGGARTVVAESVLVKHQLLILGLPPTFPQPPFAARLVAGVCTPFIRPGGLIRSAIVLKRARSNHRGNRVARSEWDTG